VKKTNLTSNMNKSITVFAGMAAVGALVVLAQSAQSQVLYDNTTGNTGYNLNFAGSAGNEVDLAGPSSANYLITGFIFQYDFVGTGTPTGSVDLSFYRNDGFPQYHGYYTPGTLLYDSGPFSLTSFTSPAGAQLVYGVPDLAGGTGSGVVAGGVIVPDQFTWVVTFSDLGAGDSAGLGLYNPPTVGDNYGNNAWMNDGSGWVLEATIPPYPPAEFGARITGSQVPDSSCLPLSVLSVAMAFGWMKRFQRRG
jgi:hypothetical protein